MSPDDTAYHLRDLPFAGALSPAVFTGFADTLATVGTVDDVEPGDALFTEGDPASDQGIVLLTGAVSIRKPGAPESEQPAPELLGEISRFNPTRIRTATVTASAPCKVLRFTWANFENAARRRMNDADFDALMKTLEEYAWQHFTQ